jgi:hypothetical protein
MTPIGAARWISDCTEPPQSSIWWRRQQEVQPCDDDAR